ncbi:alpha/beta hydrolase [candidate division KSB1 bacterium]|nr:alpha/beta hydrolase [candidate division KSB1 bacterium]
MELSPSHPFRSVKAKEKYLKYYERKSQKWPIDYEDQMIKTSQGETFVRISGQDDAPPLVLLASGGAPSLIWIPNVKMLSESFKVYAIDNIYDFGRSRHTQVFKTPNDLMIWLDELFGALELGNNINLMGLSYGGWLASQYALHSPEKLQKVVLIAPAATIFDLPSDWAWRGILSAIPIKIIMKKVMIDWAFKDLVEKGDEASQIVINDIMNDALMALKCFKFKMPIHPTVLSDDELHGISIPTLFLVGENEVIYSAHEAIGRLNSVAPQIKTEIIPDAGHDLTIIQAELVNKKVIEFLKQP